MAGFRYREIVRRLGTFGFQFDRQAAGSHEIWFNRFTKRYTTVPNHPGDMPEGTLRAILRQAGVSIDGSWTPKLSPDATACFPGMGETSTSADRIYLHPASRPNALRHRLTDESRTTRDLRGRINPMSPEEVPTFADAHPEVLAERFHTATQQGRVRRLSQTNLPGASETVTIRIPGNELIRARELAAKRGLGYQTYLKMLLHEALDAEEKKLAN